MDSLSDEIIVRLFCTAGRYLLMLQTCKHLRSIGISLSSGVLHPNLKLRANTPLSELEDMRTQHLWRCTTSIAFENYYYSLHKLDHIMMKVSHMTICGLRKISITHSTVTLTGMQLICRHMPKLLELKFRNNYISPDAFAFLARKMGEAEKLLDFELFYNSGLSEVNLSDITLLGQQMQKTTKMQHLLVKGSGKGGLAQFDSPFLHQMKNLKTLQIQVCGNSFAPYMRAQAQGAWNHLTVLNLSHSGFTKFNGNDIASCIRHLPSLLDLDLSCNELHNEGVFYVMQALQCSKPNLQSLDLQRNSVHNQGIWDVANSLQYFTSLATLKLSNNCMKSSAAEYLSQALGNLKKLQVDVIGCIPCFMCLFNSGMF